MNVDSKGHATYYDKNKKGVHKEDLGTVKVDKNGKVSNHDVSQLVQKLTKEHGDSGEAKIAYFKTSDAQVNEMNADGDRRASSKPAETYNATNANCTYFVEDELRLGGVADSNSAKPNAMMDDISNDALYTGTLVDATDASTQDFEKQLDEKDKTKNESDEDGPDVPR